MGRCNPGQGGAGGPPLAGLARPQEVAGSVEHPLGTEHLLDREVVLASHGAFYATDQRIIRYEVRRDRERVEAITYEQLDGVVNVVAPRVQTVVLGALVVFLAVLVGPDGVAQVIFTGLGLAGMLAGFFNRRSYLEFRSAALDTKAQRRWRLAESQAEEAQLLVAVVLFPERYRPRRFALPNAAIASAARPGLRSMLLTPADRPDIVPAALDTRPDAVCLDLCGLVHSTRRDRARALVWGEVTAASKSYSRVFVRVDPATLREDLVACVWPGLSGIMMSVEGPSVLAELDDALTALEQARRLPSPVRVAALLTSGTALWAVREIIAASPRVEAVVMGVGDLAFDTAANEEEVPYLTGPHPPFPSKAYVWGRTALAAAAGGVRLLGMLGTTIAPRHLNEAPGDDAQDRLSRAARLARLSGFHGAVTLHPEAVAVCAEGFTAPDATLAEARRTLEDAASGEAVSRSRLRLATALLRNGPVSASEGEVA